jgi:hypothetical protein
MLPHHPDEDLALIEVAIDKFLRSAVPRYCFFPADKLDMNPKVVGPLLVEFIDDLTSSKPLFREVARRAQKHLHDFSAVRHGPSLNASSHAKKLRQLDQLSCLKQR